MFKSFLRSKNPLPYSLAGEMWKQSWALVLLFTSWGAKDIHLSRKCVGCGSSLEPLTLNTPLGTKDATPMRVRLPDGPSPLCGGFLSIFSLEGGKGFHYSWKKGHEKVALIFHNRRCNLGVTCIRNFERSFPFGLWQTKATIPILIH